MELLNDLLNQSLGTSNQNYADSKSNIKKCYDLFKKFSDNDDMAFGVSIYLFSFCSPVENNSDSFWFVKYKNDNIYDEYDFAIDILKNYIKYKTEKDRKLFCSRMKDIINKFGSYKNISDFISTIEDEADITFTIIAYLTKDCTYFNNMFGLSVQPSNLQSPEFISNLKNILKYKDENLKMKQKLDIIGIQLTKLNFQISQISLLFKDIQYLKDRLDKMDFRDTLKMSFKYLYNVLYSKFSQGKYMTNFWDQIAEIKRIFSLPEFNEFDYAVKFIDDIEFYQLDLLNKAAHEPTNKKGDLFNIKKYLQNYLDDNLNKIVNFFNKLPYIEEFINLHNTFYFNQKRADEEFQKKIKYSQVFEQIFK